MPVFLIIVRFRQNLMEILKMIKVENLYKWYDQKLAVEDISFSLQKGEILGFIGPNGAGKSTTMRMITGFIPISQGRVFIGGNDIDQEPAKAKSLVGYLPENAPLYVNMTVYDFLFFCAELRGFSKNLAKEKTDKVIKTCFLEGVKNQNIETLSKGYKHRTCFAQSIIHDPSVLVLDEPTDGLDPNQKREIRNLIKNMGHEKAIILSTHILEEVEAVCSRVLIIDKGRKVFDGTPESLRAKSVKSGSIIVEIASKHFVDLKDKFNKVPDVVKAELMHEDNESSVCRLTVAQAADSTSVCHNVFELCRSEDWQPVELKVDHGRLDEVFHDLTITNP